MKVLISIEWFNERYHATELGTSSIFGRQGEDRNATKGRLGLLRVRIEINLLAYARPMIDWGEVTVKLSLQRRKLLLVHLVRLHHHGVHREGL